MKFVLLLALSLLTLTPFVQAEKNRLPVDAFLSALQLQTGISPAAPADPELAKFLHENGLSVQRVETPVAKPFTVPPEGADLLRFELGDTSHFDLLSVQDGPVIAIFPVLTQEFQAPPGRNKPAYFDLSPFALAMPPTAGGNAAAWKEAGETIRGWKEKIQAFSRLLDPEQRIKLAYPNRKSYARATLDLKNETLLLDEFDPGEFSAKNFVTHGDTPEVIFPILPTVYSPASDANRACDIKIGTHLLRQINKLALQDGDRILDVGTGSGYLGWLVWQTARARHIDVRPYALDINPVAVANAQYLAHLGGYQVTARTYDNVVDQHGNYAFPGTRFRCVSWNMPCLPRHPLQRLIEPETFEDYWDDGPNGIAVLNRFSAGLSGLLDPTVRKGKTPGGSTKTSVAVIWNTLPVVGGNIVEQTFQQAGFETTLLEKYPFYAVDNVIYALSSRLPTQGAK